MTDHVRPSELARFWELHPRTVYTWIKEGRLAAVRTPGNQYRLRVEDVRAFCEKERRPQPTFLASVETSPIYVLGAGAELRRAIQRSVRPAKSAIVWFDETHFGLFAAVIAPPRALVIAASPASFDGVAVARALRATAPTATVPILFFDVATTAQCTALLGAGATRAIAKSRRQEIGREVTLMIAPPSTPASI